MCLNERALSVQPLHSELYAPREVGPPAHRDLRDVNKVECNFNAGVDLVRPWNRQ